jgi:predicted porin
MKKSLIALAVAAAIPAFAQAQASNVVMYGRIDLGYNKTPGAVINNATRNATTGVVTASTNCGTNTSTLGALCVGPDAVLNMAQQSGSRFGVRGSENLGGGLMATFQIEHRFNADTGAMNSVRFWGGRSIVGLKGGFGEVNLGHNYTPLFWTQLAADPWGWDTVAQISNTQVGTQVRFSNSLEYVTPDMGGLQGRVMFAPSEVTSAKGKANFGLSAVYNGGPLYVGFGYEKHGHAQPGSSATAATTVTPAITGTTTTTALTNAVGAGTSPGAGADNKALGLTANYNLGFMKLSLNTGKTDVTPFAYTAANGTASIRNKNISATFPLGAGEFRATIGDQTTRTVNRAAATSGIGGVAGIDSLKVRDIGLGYHHNLSNRTTLYADFNRGKTDSIKSVSGVGVSSSVTATSYDFGVKHNF